MALINNNSFDDELDESDDSSNFLELIHADKGQLRRTTYECTKSGSHISQVTSNRIKRFDAIYNTNRFQMMFCIIAVTDSNYGTRIIANTFPNVQYLSCILESSKKSSKENMAVTVKYLPEILYIAIESWAIPCIYNHFMQRVESIDRDIHDIVDCSTSLSNLVNKTNIEAREQEQEIQQIIFSSLARTISQEAILETNSYSSQRLIKSNKAIYAELFGLLRKLIDHVIKVNLEQELLNKFKMLIYDSQNEN
ncbi:9153_t:CDS:2 [Diversispora eburnea]|uniref:9153_t:CDS:1 n=1 Tax=Diversispora eburnea TaxID=1213867 RepID=A0A9N9C3A7_9GLOM|nr:9153_t:CDS:2 [Diversispora eburnea]